MIPDTTKEYLAGALNGESFTAPTHMAWGDSSTAASATDTSLASEIERNELTSERNARTVEYISTLNTTEANGSTIQEVGMFNAATNGTIFSRSIISPISKNSTFEIQTINRLRVK